MSAGDERVTVITGGTRGIGAATARLLAADPGTLVLTYRGRQAEAYAVAEELRGRAARIETVRCDVAELTQVAELFAGVDRWGTLAGLVNNAGILETECRLTEIAPERWQRVFAVNVFGAAECCRQAVLRMSTERGGRGGSIVNVSSRAAEFGSPGEYVDYAASKAALDTMTRGLALEVGREGIRVNAVRPGIIDTEIHAVGRVERLGPQGPMGRAGTASEVAETIRWLLSDASSFVTGVRLDVSGGR